MTGDNIESIKSTIAKLITLANNDGATENEARVAMDRAKKLMAKYSLEEAQVLREKIKEGVDIKAVQESADCYYDGKFWNWEPRLGWQIALIFECKAVRSAQRYDWEREETNRQMHFVGLPNDLSLVLYFFDYCQDEVGRHMELAYPDGGQRKQNSFALGMVERILERLQEFYKKYQEQMASDCTDIVIFKKDTVQKAYNEAFPNAKASRSSSRPLSKEYMKGRAAGNHVHLSSNLRQVQEGS
jgi:CRISPR/Cas system-associated endoribonuclease Cas2